MTKYKIINRKTGDERIMSKMDLGCFIIERIMTRQAMGEEIAQYLPVFEVNYKIEEVK